MSSIEVNQTVPNAITNSMDSRAAALNIESTDNTINERKVKIHAGSVCPEGVVNMFNFDGMDSIQAVKEELDNSIDWRIPHIKLNINFIVNNNDELIYCDNGQGMTDEQLERAFCLFNENLDAGGNRTGKCGYGLKSALHKLSNCGKHTIITSSDGVTYLTQKTDWSSVTVMDGAFPIYDSCPSEIEDYKKYIKGSGTMIKVKLTCDSKELLDNQFTNDMSSGNIKDYMSFAYARIPDINISYKYKSDEEEIIKFYNPFGLQDVDYLFGRDGRKTTELEIKIWPSGHEVISWYDLKQLNYGYFHKKTKNMDKSPTFCENETDLPPPNAINSIKPDIIKLQFTTACLKPRDDYFDMNNPKIPEYTGMTCISDYKEQFVGKSISNDLNGTMIVNRNGTNNGLVPLGKRAQTGGAGTAKQKFKRVHMEKELSFQSTSAHNDNTDKYMGINKTKHNYVLPGNCEMLRRVCEYLAEDHGDYLWEMIEKSAYDNNEQLAEATNEEADVENNYVEVAASLQHPVVEETNSSDDEGSDVQTLALQQATADPLDVTDSDWQDSVTQDDYVEGVEETKGGDDVENGGQATAGQHNTVTPLHVIDGVGQGTDSQEHDDESSDGESSDEESSDEESSVAEDVTDNSDVIDTNITATICAKAEQIYTDSTNINYTQEDDDVINNLMDKIIAIQNKYNP